MLIPKKNRIECYSFLFKEGVLVAKKDKVNKHHILEMPNLYVRKMMQSLESRGYVREVFNWQWHYWFLTPEGIEYLRGFLGLPSDVLPATLRPTRQTQPLRSFGRDRERGDRGDRRPRTFRDEKDKSLGPDSSFNPEFRSEREYRREGGFGRGGFGRGGSSAARRSAE